VSLSIPLMVSSGEDTNQLREIVNDVARRLNHLFTYRLGSPLSINGPDYRLDPPQVSKLGTMRSRSLKMVEDSECMIAILGEVVPPITREEILRAFELRAVGHVIRVMLFLNPAQKTAEHDSLLCAISEVSGYEIKYTRYSNALEFQAAVMMALFEYVFQRMKRQTVTGNTGDDE
jgi:hypothetical protein